MFFLDLKKAYALTGQEVNRGRFLMILIFIFWFFLSGARNVTISTVCGIWCSWGKSWSCSKRYVYRQFSVDRPLRHSLDYCMAPSIMHTCSRNRPISENRYSSTCESVFGAPFLTCIRDREMNLKCKPSRQESLSDLNHLPVRSLEMTPDGSICSSDGSRFLQNGYKWLQMAAEIAPDGPRKENCKLQMAQGGSRRLL